MPNFDPCTKAILLKRETAKNDIVTIEGMKQK